MLFIISKFVKKFFRSSIQNTLYFSLNLLYVVFIPVFTPADKLRCSKSEMLNLYRFLIALAALDRILMIHFQAVEADSSQTSHKEMVHETTLVLQDRAPQFLIGHYFS